MNKVFLYLYPIKEFPSIFLFHDDLFYDKLNIKRPFPILNECIDKRYRQNGYQVVFALFPDKEMYGIEKKDNDKVIFTDVKFSEFSSIDEEGNRKENFIPKYPSEIDIINKLGPVDELKIGGYHAMDCVKRVADKALESGIDTLIDLDLTDLFFTLYKQDDYFNIEEYDPERFKNYMINRRGEEMAPLQEKIFYRNYDSPAYGFGKNKTK